MPAERGSGLRHAVVAGILRGDGLFRKRDVFGVVGPIGKPLVFREVRRN